MRIVLIALVVALGVPTSPAGQTGRRLQRASLLSQLADDLTQRFQVDVAAR
jgi:hypothetical protein